MKQRITTLQAIVIIVIAIVPSSLFYIPSFVIQIAKQDGWISVLLALAVSLLLAVVIGHVCMEGNRKPLLEWLQSRFGKLISTGLGLILCVYYFVASAVIVRQFTNFMSEQALMNTPMAMLAGIIVLVSVYIASQGIESLSRVIFVVFLFFMFSVGLNIILIWGQFDFNQFLPIFESPPADHMEAMLMPLGCLSEIAVLLLLVPYLETPTSSIKVAIWGTVISGTIFVCVSMVTIAVFGTKIIGAISYPAFAAIGTVEIGHFIERVDVLLISAWTASMFAQVSIFTFGFFQLTEQTFKLTPHFSHYAAGGVLILATALFAWPSNVVVAEFSYTTLTLYFLLNNYAICMLVWFGLHLTKHKATPSVEGL
ncbi:spore germination protein KB [Paenibacillus endophyticus]|uniref:Spore germination protein KB n=1 Tax=Paenibacillus endophyticus TaxID=1294268 RepID=A0A7W5C305_9BACL|nr:endospore germination permease [Paenibacillus endophyticus]MBB3150156.1 spore germination protein KB [Paenibacillus endophyticus]